MRRFMARLLGWFGRPHAEADLAAELESHLQLHIDDNLRAGMSAVGARRQALLKLGGIELVKEQWRERHGFPGLENLARDLRHAIRILARNRGMTAAAVLSLALGIGANTAIFSVTDALVLKSLPVERPEQLVVFADWDPTLHQWTYFFTYGEYQQLRRRSRSFSGMATSWTADRSNVVANGRTDESQTHIGLVSGNYFSVLGARLFLGRNFADNETAAVISSRYWEQRFGMAPDVVGRTIAMNGVQLTIVGVAPRSFTGDSVGQPIDFWIPAAMAPRAVERWSQRLEVNPVRVIARLRPGVTVQQAQAEARVLYRQIAGEMGRNGHRHEVSQNPDRIALLPEGHGISRPREHYQRPLGILTIVAGLVLLIACANVANLLLTRSEARRKEMAVRLALGAGRTRIVRQLLMESVVLAILAGTAGLLLAWWGTSGLAALARVGPWAVDLNLAPDGRLLGYTAAICMMAALLFGLAPAVTGSRVGLYASMKGASTGGGRFRLGRSLVVLQVGLSLVLLIGAGLFVRTLSNLKSQDLGFDHDHLLLVRTNPSARHDKTNAFEELARIPGVRSVSGSHFGMLGNAVFVQILIPGKAPRSPADRVIAVDQIAPGYLETTGMRLVAGRGFVRSDMTNPPRTAVVNISMARRFFERTDVVGRSFVWDDNPRGTPIEIIGVVEDVAYNNLRTRGAAMLYFPESDWQDLTDACLVIRTAGSTPGIAGLVRQKMREKWPWAAVRSIDSVEAAMDQSLAIERIVAWMAGLFGALALVLACVGLYGVMSYVAARRTSEIGIRMSLGATPRQVAQLVLGDALMLAAAGVAIGVLVALAGGRSVASLLFGVAAADGVVIAGSTALLLAVTITAAWIPAWRASRINPLQALRAE